jgi:hypothetical protein
LPLLLGHIHLLARILDKARGDEPLGHNRLRHVQRLSIKGVPLFRAGDDFPKIVALLRVDPQTSRISRSNRSVNWASSCSCSASTLRAWRRTRVRSFAKLLWSGCRRRISLID